MAPDITQAPTGNKTEPLARSGDGVQRIVANGMAIGPVVRTVVALENARSSAAARSLVILGDGEWGFAIQAFDF
jgi:hypothetical protein